VLWQYFIVFLMVQNNPISSLLFEHADHHLQLGVLAAGVGYESKVTQDALVKFLVPFERTDVSP
jgi:hypothetical protein